MDDVYWEAMWLERGGKMDRLVLSAFEQSEFDDGQERLDSLYT